MIISANTTGKNAALTFMTDNQAQEYCVVVVKGTFHTDNAGRLSLCDTQRPLYFTDIHIGDPESTPILYGTDFTLMKPYAEVLVVGNACAVKDKPVKRIVASLQIGRNVKQLEVIGDRYWMTVGGELIPSDPMPFTRIPLTYDRTFGGFDDTDGESGVAVVPENPCGTGFNPKRVKIDVEGTRLPNISLPGETLRHFRGTMTPIGIGVIGRHWQPRASFAGTYDQHWLDHITPFLPADFDTRYFMNSTPDQWCPYFKGGEIIRCVNMSLQQTVSYAIPEAELAISFHFDNRIVRQNAVLDTVVLEPHRQLAMLTWRASQPVGKKLLRLKEIKIGQQPAQSAGNGRRMRNGKPYFSNLGSAVAWLQSRHGRRT